MSEEKKEAPKQESDALTPEELEQAAGGLLFTSNTLNTLNTLNTTVKPPTVGGTTLPGTGGTVL